LNLLPVAGSACRKPRPDVTGGETGDHSSLPCQCGAGPWQGDPTPRKRRIYLFGVAVIGKDARRCAKEAEAGTCKGFDDVPSIYQVRLRGRQSVIANSPQSHSNSDRRIIS